MGGDEVDRIEAAALLGVPLDADPDTVRRAWRLWARAAHPDAGGDPAHFTRLDEARQALLRNQPSAPLVPTPRLPLRAVMHRPAHRLQLLGGAILVLGAALLPQLLAGVLTLPLALAAIPAAATATAWSVWAARQALDPAADRGHRIAALALLWGPLALGQLLVSTIAGTSLLPVLPVLALPIAAVVALLDPSTGLWR